MSAQWAQKPESVCDWEKTGLFLNRWETKGLRRKNSFGERMGIFPLHI